MPDGTTRFFKNGKPIFHYMGTSTFAETCTVVPEISLAKISKSRTAGKSLPAGVWCHDRHGGGENTAKVQPGDTVAVFGLGGIGLSVIIGAVMAKTSRIIAIDINEDKI